MNRPFAILKDLLPPRDKPRREKPEGAPDRPDGKSASSGKPGRPAEARQRGPRRPEGGAAPQSRPPRQARQNEQDAATGNPEANTEAAAARGNTDAPRRGQPRQGGPRPDGRQGQPRSQDAKNGQRRRSGPPRQPRAEAPAAPPVDPAVLAAQAEQAAKAAARATQQRELADEGLRALTERHPTLFDRQKPVPLAIGIHKPLLEAARTGELAASVAAVRAAIGRWTSSKHYLAILTAGAARLNLEGEATGEVNAEQAEAASTWLEKRKAQQKTRGGRGGRKSANRPQGGAPAAATDAAPATTTQADPASEATPAPANQEAPVAPIEAASQEPAAHESAQAAAGTDPAPAKAEGDTAAQAQPEATDLPWSDDAPRG